MELLKKILKDKGGSVMLPKEKPCERCIHKKVCEAKGKYEEIDIKVTHPFFKVKVECTQFEESMNKPRIIGR